MSWIETTRREYERRGRRYASDITEEEWALSLRHRADLARDSEVHRKLQIAVAPDGNLRYIEHRSNG